MIRILRALTIQPERRTLPIVSTNTLKLELYAADFPREFLDSFESYFSWRFGDVLPKLHDGSFFLTVRERSTSSPLMRAGYQHEGITPEDKESGNLILLRLAEYLLHKLDELPWHLEGLRQQRQALLTSLNLDGLVLSGARLIPADSAIVNQSAEVAFLKQKIQQAGFPNESTIGHHYEKAEDLYTQRNWDPCIGEWRKFLERLLRDIGEVTATERKDSPADSLTMRDLFAYLVRVGFFDTDEAQCVGPVTDFFVRAPTQESSRKIRLVLQCSCHLYLARC